MMDGSSSVFVGVDGEVAGALVMDDPIRPDTPRVIRSLRRSGIQRVVMVTGDHPDVAERSGAALGVDRILSERAPDEKVEAVAPSASTAWSIMVGDGLNDAPALAAADVGVAMGARGATASSEAADVVLVVDRLDRLVEAITIARRSRGIAVQSVLVGMGLAFGFMGFGGDRSLRPVAGAVIQEGIDVMSILNALRAIGGDAEIRPSRASTDVADRFRREHREFAPSSSGSVGRRPAGEMSARSDPRARDGKGVPRRAAPAARRGGGGRRLSDRGEPHGRRGPDVQHVARARRDLAPRSRVPAAAGGPAARGPITRRSPRPSTGALRPARDPPPALRAGGGGLRVVVFRRPVPVG